MKIVGFFHCGYNNNVYICRLFHLIFITMKTFKNTEYGLVTVFTNNQHVIQSTFIFDDGGCFAIWFYKDSRGRVKRDTILCNIDKEFDIDCLKSMYSSGAMGVWDIVSDTKDGKTLEILQDFVDHLMNSCQELVNIGLN